MTLSDIKNITDAAVQFFTSSNEDADKVLLSDNILELAFDSRKIQTPEHSLFIALKSAYRDGHTFIKEAYEKGVCAFLIDENVDEKLYPGAVFLKVAHTLEALQKLGSVQRQRMSALKVIGITGSNGKTITKEWLFQLLADEYKIVRNPKSYNSQIGVPISVWQIKEGEELGIFEAGISRPGEMQQLEKIIRPDWGLLTNIGDAHDEGFKTRKEKINEKLLLFQNCKKLFYCADQPELNDEILHFAAAHPQLECCAWSRKEHGSLFVQKVKKERGKTHIRALFEGLEREITIPYDDEASIENAIHCWNIALHLYVEDKKIEEKMKVLHPVAMRLERIQGINNTLLINDTYNSDLTSLQIALETLIRQRQYPKKTVILSDLFQIGDSEQTLYRDIAQWIADLKINRIIGIGTAISRNRSEFERHETMECLFFESTERFIRAFQDLTFEQEAILIKGSRVFKFEKIERLLEQKVHRTILEINLSAIVNNYRVYKNLLPKEVKMMAMVKAYSYGSGSYEIAAALQSSGIDYLGVAYLDEGVMLRKAGITTPIMVMNPELGGYDRMIQWKLEPEIYGLEALNHFRKVAKTLGVKHYPVHLMIDTGMHRLGFLPENLEGLKKQLKDCEEVHVVSIFSHLSGSGSSRFDDYTRKQIQTFETAANDICTVLKHEPMFHILNSTGITRHGQYHFDMVRLGLGLYGIDSSEKVQPLLTCTGILKTAIAQIHEVKAGEFVGYDLRGEVSRDSRIATVNIGYADGYLRFFGNNGKSYMLVHGKKAPIIGSICMDMCMLDVTDIPEAKAGDEAVVFGENPNLNQLAEWAGTIPYEIMTGISQRVNRVYVEE